MSVSDQNTTTAENVNQLEDYGELPQAATAASTSEETVQTREGQVSKKAKELGSAVTSWFNEKTEEAKAKGEEMKEKAGEMAKDAQTTRAGDVHHDTAEEIEKAAGTAVGTVVGLGKTAAARASGAIQGLLSATAKAGSPEKLIATRANQRLSQAIGKCSASVQETEDGEQVLHYSIDPDVARGLGLPARTTAEAPVNFQADGVFTAKMRVAEGREERTFNCLPLADGECAGSNVDKITGIVAFAAEKGRQDVRFFVRS